MPFISTSKAAATKVAASKTAAAKAASSKAAAAKVAAKVAGVKVIATKTAVFGDIRGGNWGTGLDGNCINAQAVHCDPLPNNHPSGPYPPGCHETERVAAKAAMPHGSVCVGYHDDDGSCTGIWWGDD